MATSSQTYQNGGQSFEQMQTRFTAFYEDECASQAVQSNESQIEVSFTRNSRESNSTMSVPTREEIDAKLELIETRMDGRVAAIERSVQASIDESRGTRSEIRSLKWTILFTAVATVVALWGVNAAIFSNMVASFESGKNTASAQADVKKQTEETAALLKKIQEQLDGQKAERAASKSKDK